MPKPAVAGFTDAMFPLLWTLTRQYRKRRLTNPLDWFRATRLPQETQALANALERMLSRDGIGDYTSWVLEDLPTGRAHMIDSDTDAIWAFLLLLAVRSSVPLGENSFKVGESTYSRRETFEAVFLELDARAAEIETDLALPEFATRVLPAIREQVSAAMRSYRALQLEGIRRAELSPTAIDEILAAAIQGWRSSLPRRVLEVSGSIVFRRREATGRQRYALGATAPKIFFLADGRAIDDAPTRIGEDLGRGVGRSEGRLIAERWRKATLIKGPASLDARIAAALAELDQRGTPATHCFVALAWRYRRRRWQTHDPDPESEWQSNLEFIEWHEWHDDSMLFVSLPAAITVTQYLEPSDKVDHPGLYLTVRELDAESTSPEVDSEPALYVEVFERWSVRTAVRAAIRVHLGEGLNSPS